MAGFSSRKSTSIYFEMEMTTTMKVKTNRGLMNMLGCHIQTSGTIKNLNPLLRAAFKPSSSPKTLYILIPGNVPNSQAEQYARNWLLKICESLKPRRKHGPRKIK